jgi:glycine/D-amino acid oxidase-like deaminating enzyme
MTRVVVAGAGIGGLTLGIALARAGAAVDLHERADELREVGAAVALSANGTRLLHRLGIGEALDAVSTQPTELIHRDGRTGARIAAQSVEYDPATALATYPRHRRARTRAIAASAWDTGTLLHLADDHPHLAERDRRFACYLPADDWVHDHDAEDLATPGRVELRSAPSPTGRVELRSAPSPTTTGSTP